MKLLLLMPLTLIIASCNGSGGSASNSHLNPSDPIPTTGPLDTPQTIIADIDNMTTSPEVTSPESFPSSGLIRSGSNLIDPTSGAVLISSGNNLINTTTGTVFVGSGSNFINTETGSVLISTGSGFIDSTTGQFIPVFEKIGTTSKDLVKIQALAEQTRVKSNAEYISNNLGLSLERSTEIAKLKEVWKKSKKKSMTVEELNQFSHELLGFSIQSGVSAYRENLEGDSNQLDLLIDQAALTNRISPEHASKIMESLFDI